MYKCCTIFIWNSRRLYITYYFLFLGWEEIISAHANCLFLKTDNTSNRICNCVGLFMLSVIGTVSIKFNDRFGANAMLKGLVVYLYILIMWKIWNKYNLLIKSATPPYWNMKYIWNILWNILWSIPMLFGLYCLLFLIILMRSEEGYFHTWNLI